MLCGGGKVLTPSTFPCTSGIKRQVLKDPEEDHQNNLYEEHPCGLPIYMFICIYARCVYIIHIMIPRVQDVIPVCLGVVLVVLEVILV